MSAGRQRPQAKRERVPVAARTMFVWPMLVCALVGMPHTPFFSGAAAKETAKTIQLAQLAPGASPLTVPPTLTAPASSSVALPIGVSSPRDLPPNSFLRMRGLPPAVSLSDGYAIAPGVWAIPLTALSALRLVIPVGVVGIFDVTASLVAVDGAPIAEAKIRLTVTEQVGAAPAAPPAPAAPARPKTVAPSPPPVLTPEAIERAEKFVQRGEKELADGNVAQARGFFMRAAEVGLARGAMLLAGTYDPAELSRLRVQGVQPNPSEARRWYERARELGAPEATERLSALRGR